jgi:hypothetical protein
VYNAIGGNKLSGYGGYLQFWNWQGQPGNTDMPTLPLPINFAWLEVAYWKLHIKSIAPINWYSGLCGAISRRVVAVDWQLSARVWWDYTMPPETALRQGDATAVKLVIGADSQWTGNPASDIRVGGFFNQLGLGGAGLILPSWPPNAAQQPRITNPPVQPFVNNGDGILNPETAGVVPYIPCYVAPLCVFEEQEAVDGSEGQDGEDGIVYEDITIGGDSLLWYLPTLQWEAQYTGYVNQLVAQNMIPFSQAL